MSEETENFLTTTKEEPIEEIRNITDIVEASTKGTTNQNRINLIENTLRQNAIGREIIPNEKNILADNKTARVFKGNLSFEENANKYLDNLDKNEGFTQKKKEQAIGQIKDLKSKIQDFKSVTDKYPHKFTNKKESYTYQNDISLLNQTVDYLETRIKNINPRVDPVVNYAIFQNTQEMSNFFNRLSSVFPDEYKMAEGKELVQKSPTLLADIIFKIKTSMATRGDLTQLKNEVAGIKNLTESQEEDLNELKKSTKDKLDNIKEKIENNRKVLDKIEPITDYRTKQALKTFAILLVSLSTSFITSITVHKLVGVDIDKALDKWSKTDKFKDLKKKGKIPNKSKEDMAKTLTYDKNLLIDSISKNVGKKIPVYYHVNKK